MRISEFGFVGPLIGPDDVVFDIGAHGGLWTSALCKAAPKGHVYAFEALPYYAGVLKLTARLCGWRNASVINKAVQEDAKPISMVWRDSASNLLTGTTHVAGLGDEGGDTVTVEGVTLDQFRDQIGSPRIAFIKLDIEGFELPVLRGAERLIEECQPLLWCELWAEYTQRYGYTPSDVFDFFTKHHYRTFIVDDANRALVPTSAETYPDRGDILAAPSQMSLPPSIMSAVKR